MSRKTFEKIKTNIKLDKEYELKESLTQFINNIIINHIEQNKEHFIVNNKEICFLEQYFNLYNSKNFYKYYFKLQYISNIKNVYKNNNNKIKKQNYMTTFIYLIIYIIKLKNSKVFDKKKKLLKEIANLIFKLYTMNIFNNSDILLIIKFIIYSSIYQRKDIYDYKTESLNELNNKIINNYNIFKYSIEIVKIINNFEITEQYYEFLINKILKNKTNLFLISNKLDLLELLFLENNENNEKKIIKFLAEVYSFKYNKSFLDIFFQKINNKYSYYKVFNPIDLFNDINKSLFLLKELQNKEDELYKKDSYILNYGFVCNNDRYNGITIDNVILQSEFTIIFSFNFSPELDTFDIVNQKDILNSSNYKMKQQNILQKDTSIYPLLYIMIDNNRISNDGLNFYIQDGYLYHKVFNYKNEIKICPVEQNMTYMCCYTIQENLEFIIYIKSEKENKLYREKYHNMFKKNLTLKLGKFVRRNFEGYIGPVLLFKKYYDAEFLKAIANLRGFYDKMLFIHNFSNEFINKYDRIQNYLKISDTKKKKSYLNAINEIIEENNIIEDLNIIIRPVYEGSRLDKKNYVDCTFKETKIMYYTKPKVENGATFFFRYNYTPFEFVRYEGINYIILIFELISTNVDDLKNEFHKDIFLNLFVNVIDFSKNIVNLLCPDYYNNEMKRLLFAFEKCIINICKKIKMCHKINKALADLILFLSSKLPGLSQEKVNNNINIRNELLKLLVDTDLYDLNDYSSLSYFLRSFNDIFTINSIGILNMDFFTKIINFSVVFEQITNPKNNEIKKNIEFKKFKNKFVECLNSFFGKSETPAPFIYIFEIFANNNKFNYYKYQFLKIFYLNSEIYFSNIEDTKRYILTWKYFTKLYESIQSKKTFKEISKKEAQIIMAICLRIIFENPVVGDFYKSIKKSKNNLKTSINKNDNYISNKKSIWKFAKEEEEKTFYFHDDKSKYFTQRKRTFSYNSEIKNQLYSNENKNNNNYIRENSEDRALNCKVNKYGFKTNNKKKDIILNKMNINSKNSFEINNNHFSNEKCVDYKYFVTLFPKLCSSTNFNDYCFRSLLLLILEKNNEVNISQKVKYKFIAKIKKYEDFEDKDYSNFLKIKYLGKETKSQLISLLDLIEKNVNQLSSITYDIMLYLIIKTSEDKKKNKCVFKHLISSKKICGRLFVLAFTHNKQALISIFGKISKLFDLIIPYHKNPFIFDFIYDIMTNEELRDHGQVLINLMAIMSFDNGIDLKFYYHFHVKILLLLYRIIKSKDIKNENYIFEEQVISNIFKEDLITTKYNMLYNIPWAKGKKKCYVELLFEVLVGLCIKTKNDKYYLILYKMFISYVTKFTNNEGDFSKLNDKKPHSILFFIDQVSSPCNKSNPIQKYFSKYDTIDVPSLTLKILLKTLKYYIIYKNSPVKDILISLSSAFHLDANEIFLSKDSKRKKEYKNKILYNQLRNIIINSCKKPKGKDKDKKINFISHDSLIMQFEKIYNNYLNNKINLNKTIDFHHSISFLPIFKIKFDDNNLSDDSFSSCKSDKNSKNQCIINNKKKFKTTNKDNLKNMFEDIEKNEDLFNINANEININLMNFPLIHDKSDKENNFKKEKKDIKNIEKKNPFNFEKINNCNEVYLFPKQNLIEQIFAIYFINRLFYNEPFIKMRNYYKYIVKNKTGKIIDMKNYFNYPTIMKNYIPENIYFGGLFLKHDLNFFTNDYFNISHPYFIKKSKNIYINRLFKKKSQQNDINKFILNKNDHDNNMFYVDLITNRKVIFGELIVGKYLIYFHSKDKKQFLKGKSDKEIESWILCSSEYDYSSKKKKIYIFKEEITEIINRRFLYSFQACEFYLKNGKSYFFNFYSEDKKIKFFSLFSKKKFIISDLKSDFKKQNFTKRWLNDNISTLEYLLFINKYSCRSYNDVNQYPVFPWLKIYGEKERDLRYTIVAQTEEERMVLKEIYSINNFPHHYTTHYSNASFLIYYLLRVNPFTDNQITLQVKKFDLPERQFTSFDELQRILFKTKQPREIIPEFFINTNFFYNYNCNFFGIKNDGQLVDNLAFNKNYKSPLDYVLSNATMLESTKVKSTINYFFDNIFGVGQMGGCEKYNTYDKYCYQEMIDLNHKINSFQAKGLTLKEIKEKIARKTNKIISFGQTPFKLLEDQHPQWSNEKIIEKNNKNMNSYIKFKYQIIHFGFLNNKISSKSLCFVLTKKSINNFELCFYDLGLKEELEKDKDKVFTILIPKKIKLFSKLYIFDSRFLFAYKYNPKFIMINYELLIFIFSHLTDNSFTVFNQKGNYKSYLTSSLITCIIKGPYYNFLTGHIDGKIIEWKIFFKKEEGTNYVNLEEIKIEKKREYIAHKKNVNGIYYSNLLDLIISSGDDKIYIRKYYDLSLLSVINTENKLCIELKINHCHLYILFYNEIVKSYIIKIYSLNGILVGKSDYCLINNFDVDKDGNILVGYFKEHKIDIFNPSIKKKINEIKIDIYPLINSSDNSNKIENNTIDNNSEEIPIFQSFYYQPSNKSVYCSFSNGYLIKKYIGSEK